MRNSFLACMALAGGLFVADAASGQDTIREPIEAPYPVAVGLTSDVLDELIAAEMGQAWPGEPLTDDMFLRRASLDLIGRQPTPEEADAFLADASADRRSQLVERLLASPEFGTNWANYWSDTISYRTPPPELTFLDYGPFEDWLAQKLNDNVAWNEIVAEVLTGTGKVRDAPQATFVAYHEANPVRLASETARIFLSVQIQCAQCHDHPFEHWKREQFHQLAAFFARAKVKFPWNDGLETEIKENEKGEYSMPNVEDPSQKGTMMNPSFLTGKDIEPGQGDAERRQGLAAFVTGSDNPWFAKSYTNRVWGRLMGSPFAEPVDDLSEQLAPRMLPDVHDHLSQWFVLADYDVKAFFRLVMNTRAYQAAPLPSGEDQMAVAGATKLRGDEVFDSLVAATGLPNYFPPKLVPTAAVRFPPPPKSTRDLVSETFGYDPSLPKDAVVRTMSQAMLLMNNVQLMAQIDASPDSGTHLSKLLADEQDDRTAVVRLFRGVLGRAPSDREVELALEHVESVGQRGPAFEDLLWSLINTAEFTTRR